MSLRELGWPTSLASTLALACGLIAAFAELPYGGTEIWPLPVAALACLAFAVWRTHRWWLLLLIPFILWPVLGILGLLAACATGDCI